MINSFDKLPLLDERLILTNAQRMLLAEKAKLLGRKGLQSIQTLFTPDTLLRWHRELCAAHHTYDNTSDRLGRPTLPDETIQSVLAIALANRSWGYDRIVGALANVGIEISASSVRNILMENGIEPAPDDITNPETGFLKGKKILLLDRDTKFPASFHQKLKDAGIEPTKTPPRSPNCNAHIERFFRSIKTECLRRMIFFGETMLLSAVTKYLDHYHRHRNHQGISNLRITPPPDEPIEGKIVCDEQLGGILKYYYRQTA